MTLCRYKDIFGKEKEGIHSIRLFGVAIIDYIMTVVGSYMISYYYNLDFWKVHLSVLVLGVILHRLFCVNTEINKLIFGFISDK